MWLFNQSDQWAKALSETFSYGSMVSHKADNFSKEWKRDLEHIVLAGGAQRLRK